MSAGNEPAAILQPFEHNKDIFITSTTELPVLWVLPAGCSEPFVASVTEKVGFKVEEREVVEQGERYTLKEPFPGAFECQFRA